jgi:hypothetical protein
MSDMLLLKRYKMQISTKYYINESVKTLKKRVQEYSLLLIADLSVYGKLFSALKEPRSIMTRTTGTDEHVLVQIGKRKGKAIPLHAWTGPGGSGRLRLPDFKTIST